MAFYQRSLKVAGLALLLTCVYLGTLLSAPGYCENLTFVFIADSRASQEDAVINTAALDDLIGQILKLKTKPAFVIYGGDIALYGINEDGSNNFLPFKDRMRKLTDKGIKLYMALGNHELYRGGPHKSSYLVGQQQHQQVFTDMPGNGPPGYEKLVYSFESPEHDAFFAILDPFYLDAIKGGYKQKIDKGAIDTAQREWLQKEVDKTKATHKFLIMHSPVCTVSRKHKAPDSSSMLWDILDKARFDLFLCGHEHLYSRKALDSKDLKVEKPLKNKVVQLINGGAGAPANDDLKHNLDRKDWHIFTEKGKYYYTVVDIKGKQVTVNTLAGSNNQYSSIDEFSIPETGKAESPGK